MTDIKYQYPDQPQLVIVGIREVHVRHVVVNILPGEDPFQAAKEKTEAGQDDLLLEYSHLMSEDTWSVDAAERCGRCQSCAKVSKTRDSILAAFAKSDVKGRVVNGGSGIGEDAALIWNDTLRDFPCTNPQITG
jgi:hypothetical protein